MVKGGGFYYVQIYKLRPIKENETLESLKKVYTIIKENVRCNHIICGQGFYNKPSIQRGFSMNLKD